MTTTETTQPFFTTSDLQERWKCSHMTIRRIRLDGYLKPFQFGKRGVRFALDDVLRYEQASAA